MKHHAFTVVLLISALSSDTLLSRRVERAPALAVHFSPAGGCTREAVAQIDAAKRQILVQGYSFTSRPIAGALIAAKTRGVDVRIVLDRGQRTDKRSAATVCALGGCEVTYDAKHAIAHNKIMIIDDAIVLTGSFNWTSAAESSNAENLLTIRDARMAAIYKANWQAHRAHSQ
jgi:phosphatidylserine/phosphatidylglycerophosphate/cardiolipin synthase-like enzyme